MNVIGYNEKKYWMMFNFRSFRFCRQCMRIRILFYGLECNIVKELDFCVNFFLNTRLIVDIYFSDLAFYVKILSIFHQIFVFHHAK